MKATGNELGEKLASIGRQLLLIAAELSGETEETGGKRRTKEQLQSLLDAGKCVNCEKRLGNEQPRRSMHPNCYQQILDQIRDGLTSWKKLEAGNWVPRPQKGGRKPKVKTTVVDKSLQEDAVEQKAGPLLAQAQKAARKAGTKPQEPNPRT